MGMFDLTHFFNSLLNMEYEGASLILTGSLFHCCTARLEKFNCPNFDVDILSCFIPFPSLALVLCENWFDSFCTS